MVLIPATDVLTTKLLPDTALFQTTSPVEQLAVNVSGSPTQTAVFDEAEMTGGAATVTL